MKSFDIRSSLVNAGLAQFTPYLARKKACLIGIDDTHDDIKRFRTLLISKSFILNISRSDLIFAPDTFGFEDHGITMMIDDGAGVDPTKANIMATLKTFLVGQATRRSMRDMGSKPICLDGSEQDGLDEGIMTCDDTTILDDVLHDHLVKPLAPGCRLVAFFDTCHSETLLDLRHHRCNRLSHFRRTVRRLRELTPFPENTAKTRFCNGYCRRIKMSTTTPNVLCFSACKDSQRVFERSEESMLDSQEVIHQLDIEPSPTLKRLMRNLDRRAKAIYRQAKGMELSHKRAQEEKSKQKIQDHEEGDESESDTDTVFKWAPQISSTVPLWMTSRLRL
ncbi:hypothetical protein DFH09DRAFT_1308497 [Mycena vulgaris]|nr:hypothetical protein DFH09DRAFT_1308497 [Mycena vulgaris]